MILVIKNSKNILPLYSVHCLIAMRFMLYVNNTDNKIKINVIFWAEVIFKKAHNTSEHIYIIT